MTITKLSLERKTIFFYLACAWTLVIAYLCLMDFNKLPHIKIGGLDKGVHFVLHFFFTLLWYLYFRSAGIFSRKRVVVALMLSVFYGSLIEVAQALFTTTRKADVLDVLSNSVGAIIAVGVIYSVTRFSKIHI